MNKRPENEAPEPHTDIQRLMPPHTRTASIRRVPCSLGQVETLLLDLVHEVVELTEEGLLEGKDMDTRAGRIHIDEAAHFAVQKVHAHLHALRDDQMVALLERERWAHKCRNAENVLFGDIIKPLPSTALVEAQNEVLKQVLSRETAGEEQEDGGSDDCSREPDDA